MTPDRQQITKEQVCALVSYNPETGDFVWNFRTSNRIDVGVVAGYVSQQGYIKIGLYGVQYQAHRIAWLVMTGMHPLAHEDIDHINGSKIDNRWVNLRLVNRQTNLRNAKIGKRNTSGVLGVSWDERSSKWVAYIKVDGKKKSLGYYQDIDDAAKARKDANIKYGFHENHGMR